MDWALLALLSILALALRLREPLSSPVIGAEDPYRHMERTWDLVQGKALADYPPGLMVLLFPFTALGPAGFTEVARFLPLLFGVGLTVASYLLCRGEAHVAGAATAGLLAATMPETIRRTDLLFPTAIDLALLPLFFLAVLRASRGSRRAWVALAALGFFFFFLHPWVLGLVVPPLLLFTLVLLWHGRSRWRVPVAAGATAAAAALVLALPTWDAAGLVRDQAFGRLQALVAHPSSLTPLPRHVDLPAMLGWPALALAGVGAGVAAVRRTRFGLLALCWTALLLPLLLVDWFDIWYLPHRTVAYFAIGVTMLAALAVSEIFRLAGALRAGAERALTLAVVGSLLLVNLPAAATVDPWYRLYGEEDLEAWRELDRRGTPYVEAASWQARMGYRASTGRDAVFNPPFFTDELTREYELAQHPGLVVLVDRYAQEEGVPTGFLEGSDWVRLGTWGTTSAYAHA